MGVEDTAAVIGADGVQQMDVIPHPAPEKGGHVVGQLEGGIELIRLTEGSPGGQVHPRLALRGSPHALPDLDACGLTQAEGSDILIESIQAQLIAQLGKKVVAGLGEGLADVDPAVAAAVAVVDPAVGVALGVAGVGPVAGGVDNRVRADDALLQRRHGGEGLEGGAGGVGAAGGTVEERHPRIGVQRLQVLGVGPLAVVGVGG